MRGRWRKRQKKKKEEVVCAESKEVFKKKKSNRFKIAKVTSENRKKTREIKKTRITKEITTLDEKKGGTERRLGKGEKGGGGAWLKKSVQWGPHQKGKERESISPERRGGG